MQLIDLYNEFIQNSSPNESDIMSMFDMKEISEIGISKPDKINDAMGFGESVEIVSNVAAFVFLVVAQKVVETGIVIAKSSLLRTLVENKEKVIGLLKRRYENRKDIDEIVDKIIKFLSE